MMSLQKQIIPAIIAKDQNELDAAIHKVKSYVTWVQLDVMDNKFVPNTSLFFDLQVPQGSCKYEAHLMVQDPLDWIQKHGEKVHTILVHYESVRDLDPVFAMIHDMKKKAGVVLNPETPLSVVFDFIDQIEEVLVMTVNPGFYGSPFLPEMMNKIVELRQQYPELDIEVDGGITDQTIALVHDAGANLFVSGSFIMKAPDIQQAVQVLQKKTT